MQAYPYQTLALTYAPRHLSLYHRSTMNHVIITIYIYITYYNTSIHSFIHSSHPSSTGEGDFEEGAFLQGSITNISGKLGRLHVKVT